MTQNLKHIADKLEPVMQKAGDILLSHFHKPLFAREKKNAGIVTQADIESEIFLKKELGKILPDAGFFAEESGPSGDNQDYCWVIDPLDGTTNFFYGIPYFCVSVALTYQGSPVLGYIYQPLTKELFYAQAGSGSYLNGAKITVSTPKQFSDVCISLSFPYTAADGYAHLSSCAHEIVRQTHIFRSLGAAALDLAYVACGRLDGALSAGLGWWDVAAGILLVQEAGGHETDFEGKPVTQTYHSCIAGGMQVHKHLASLVQQTKKSAWVS
jgi:myo-inositol-1(or 4)-monophosphatase